MAWNGYFRYQDTEFVNVTRTLAYAQALGMYSVRDVNYSAAMPALLGDEPYSLPSLDPAPWYDSDEAESGNFAGVLPLSVDGIEDSTRETTVFEYTSDGGNPGTIRNTTKTVTFSVALVGTTEASVEYGFRWLKRALLRRDCTPGTGNSCHGERLYYSKSRPADDAVVGIEEYDGGNAYFTVDPGLEGGDAYTESDNVIDGGDAYTLFDGGVSEKWAYEFQRHLNNVVINNGPTVNSKREMSGCNGVVWIASFTAVAGDPFEWGPQTEVLETLRASAPQPDPYAGSFSGTYGYTTYNITGCPGTSYEPIYDPNYPALVAPPAPPNISPEGWITPTGQWYRNWADIPDVVVPLWDEVRPVITLRSADDAYRVRVRFYRDEFDPTADCGQAGEFFIRYLPGGVDFVIDGEQQAVYAIDGDSVRRADSLVYGTGFATPIKWFALSCGGDWHVTLDQSSFIPPDITMSLALAPRSA